MTWEHFRLGKDLEVDLYDLEKIFRIIYSGCCLSSIFNCKLGKFGAHAKSSIFLGSWFLGSWAPGFLVPGFLGSWVPGYWVPGSWVPGSWVPGFWLLAPRFLGSWFLGSWVLGFLVPGSWFLGSWTREFPAYWLTDFLASWLPGSITLTRTTFGNLLQTMEKLSRQNWH